MISQYEFHITITNIVPQDQMLWISFQYGPTITTDFYAARLYDTNYGVGGAATPLLTVTASTLSLIQNTMTELYFSITNIPSGLASTQNVIVELVPTGATLNNVSIVYHNVTAKGPVAQIDC
jgi:hypothetical protein